LQFIIKITFGFKLYASSTEQSSLVEIWDLKFWDMTPQAYYL